MSALLERLARAALSHRVMTLVIAAALVGVGVWAYQGLPIDAYPDIATPQVQVIIKAPGMSPLEAEQRITRPVEVQVRGIQHQTVLRSLTKNALSIITIDFEEGTDIYWARQQVSERLAGMLASLPPGVEGGLAPITSPLSEVYMFMVEGEGKSLRELRTLLDWTIRPRLLSVEGVADVNALGGQAKAFRVTPRERDLRARGVEVKELAAALARNNSNAGGGHVIRRDEVLVVRTLGRLRGKEDIAGLVVARRGGLPVRVRDVADVAVGAMSRYGGVSRNGRGEGVQGLVLLRTGANGRATVEKVKARLEQVAATLPAGIKLTTVYDRSDLITRAVNTVTGALGLGVALVLVVLSLFLGNLRSAITTGLILPLTVLGTFILMRLSGISANLMSLGGLAIAVGILVDASVVVVENVHTRLTATPRGLDRLHVVFRAVREVAGPVFVAVLIIVASFVPILTLSGVEGKLFVPLAATIVFALGVSLLLSLTVIPVAASLIMRGTAGGKDRLLGALKRVYRPVLAFALRRRRAAVALALIAMVGATALIPLVGREFLPTLDEGTIVIQTEKLPSISLERSIETDVKVQQALLKVPEVTGVYSRVGSDELRLDPMGFHETDSFLVTRPRDQWSVSSPAALREKLRKALEGFSWLNFSYTQPIDMRVSEMLTGVTAALAVKLYGDDLAVLEDRARAIEALLRKTRGAVDVLRTPLGGQIYMEVRTRHQAASRLGLEAADINALVGHAVGGQTVTEVVEPGRITPVVVRLSAGARRSREALGALTLRTPDGARVRLDQVAKIVEVEGPVQIEREAAQRLVVIQANVQGRDVVSLVEELRRRIREEVKLPPGYFTEFGGQFENERRASGRLLLVGPIALAAVFLLLFTAFGSVRQAGLVLLNVPFALVGGVYALFASGMYLSVPASVGFIALVGVAIENGVVLVNHFNDLRRQGVKLDDAVRQGAERRLRPVLMTAVLTILGLVPLLLASGPGSEIQRPLAVVVVGGTFTATLLTLVLLPTLYIWVERIGTSGVGRGVPGAVDESLRRSGAFPVGRCEACAHSSNRRQPEGSTSAPAGEEAP